MATYHQPGASIFQPSTTPAATQDPPTHPPDNSAADSDPETEYDRERRQRIAAAPQTFDGWRPELRAYLSSEQDKTTSKKTDLCDYWTVR